jgi:ankyrin repeat protein
MSDRTKQVNQEIVKHAIQSGNVSVLSFLNIDETEAQCCLLKSVEADQIVITQYLLENFKIAIDDYALIAAVANNNAEMVELLCDNGCVIRAQNFGAMRLAIKHNNIAIVTYFKKLGIPFDNITYTIKHADLALVRLLFDEGTDLDPAALRVACECNKLNVLIYLVSYHELAIGDTLFHAASNNRIDIVEFVLGIDTAYADDAFIIATQKGYTEIVKVIEPFVSEMAKSLVE